MKDFEIPQRKLKARVHLEDGRDLEGLMYIAAEDYDGFDRSVTIKFYAAYDADIPFFPANNFKVPPGHDSCCAFDLRPTSLHGNPPQARSRLPAQIRNGRIQSSEPGVVDLSLSLDEDEPELAVRMERVQFAAELPRDLDEISHGLIGAAWTARNLYEIDPNEISEVEVLFTMMGGKLVHDHRGR